jgi:hypothetical protein
LDLKRELGISPTKDLKVKLQLYVGIQVLKAYRQKGRLEKKLKPEKVILPMP